MSKLLKSMSDGVKSFLFRPQPPPPSPVPVPDAIKALLDAHNHERSEAGLHHLIIDSKLLAAAEKHAKWMHDSGNMSHTGKNGTSSSTRIKNEGYAAAATGENIAKGYGSVSAVMQGWMGSRGHRSNILSSRYQHCGFSEVGKYWCAVFAAPMRSDQLEFEGVYVTESYDPEPLIFNG